MGKNLVFCFAAVLALSMAASLPAVCSEQGDSPVKFEKFTGSIAVTLPDDTQTSLEPGLPAPEVPSGSTIEVVSGTAVLNVMGVKISMVSGSAVNIHQIHVARGRFNIRGVKGKTELFAGLTKITIGEGDEIILRIHRGTLRLVVLKGSVEVEEDGVKTIIPERGSYGMPFVPVVPIDEIPEPEPIEASPFMMRNR
jgi:hypothetical protein